MSPRYNLNSAKADVSLGYDMEKTGFGVAVSKDSQTFSLSRLVGENTKVSPSITSNGDFSLAIKQAMEGKGTITGTFESNKAISAEWADGPWSAKFIAPIEGYSYNGIKFTAKKKVDF